LRASIFIILILLSFIYSCKKGKNNESSCNGSSTRRDIKIAIDELSSEIDTIPIITSVDSIGSIDLIKAKKH